MLIRAVVLLALSTAGLVGCSAHDTREWMRVDQHKAEFKRDHKECTKKGDIDDACMRQRGWVPVNPSRTEGPPPSMDPLQRGRGRY